MQTPELQEMVSKNGQAFVPGTPEDFGKEIAAQWADFGKVVRERGIEVK